jgi:hypothetical protein
VSVSLPVRVNTRNRAASHAGQLMVDSNTLRLGLIAATDCGKSLYEKIKVRQISRRRRVAECPLSIKKLALLSLNLRFCLAIFLDTILAIRLLAKSQTDYNYSGNQPFR